MRDRVWRLALVMALVFMLGFSLGGWPAPVHGQDDGGDQTATAEAEEALAPIICPDLTETGEIATPTALPTSEDLTTTPVAPTPEPETEGEPGLWCQPFNISRSGAASRPAVAAEPDGTLHVLWWDEFDGSKLSYYTPEDGWSEPRNATQVLGGRDVVAGRSVRVAPIGLRMFASNNGWVHAFWLDNDNRLRYARSRSQSGQFALGPVLAQEPSAWDVSIDASGDLHLAYVRSENTLLQPAGVYYRVSTNDGASWNTPSQIETSLYFRSQEPGDAFVRVAADGAGRVLAAWQEAEFQRSFMALSEDNGRTFTTPEPVEQLDLEVAKRTRFFAPTVPGDEFLRLWEAGDACALYQQQSSGLAIQPEPEGTPEPAAPEATPTPFDFGPTWSDPSRVLDAMDGCVAAESAFPLPDGRLLTALTLANSREVLATWDGERWTDPTGLQISFVEPTTNRPITLDCMNLALAERQMAVVGCDQFGDIWITISQLPLQDLLPALTTAWSAPFIVSTTSGDAGLPSISVDDSGQIFVIWSQSQNPGEPATELMHTNSDGVNWPAPVRILQATDGQIAQPVVRPGPGGLLHLVWSGGFTGQPFYSQSFVRDARVPSGWSTSRELPAPGQVGGWPDLAIDEAGSLHVVYTVPLNEGRGVYYTRSDDQGQTWSDYVRVFDASAAGWAMVRNTHLAVDGAGRLHLVWVRAALPDVGTALGVYYARSDDGGQTWTEPLEVGGLDSDSPRIVAAAQNEILITWTHPTSTGLEILYQHSPDGGQAWSRSTPLLGLRRISAPDFSLTTDHAGTVYLVGIERSRQNAAALFYVRWDGQAWVDRESVPLGYDPAPQAGAAAALLADGTLGVLYRVRAPQEGGSAHYLVGYVSRPVTSGQAAPAPTFTPVPVENQGTPVLAPSRTPLPTPDLANVTPPTITDTVRNQITIALVAIVLVAGFAVFRLWRGRR